MAAIRVLLAAVMAASAFAAPGATTDAVVEKARAALALKNTDGALRLLAGAGQARSADAASLEGTILLRSRRPAEALAALEEACRKAPRDPYPRGLRASALADLRRFPEALEQASEARRLDPNGTDALWLLADLHGRSQNAQALSNVSRELSRRLPGDPVAPFRVALAEASLGHLTDARGWAQKAVELAPNQPRPLLLLSKIEKRMGLTQEARRHLDLAQDAGLSAGDILESEMGGTAKASTR